MSKALGVVRTNSLGEALQFVNSLDSEIEILEVSPLGKASLVILRGSGEKLAKVDWKAHGDQAILIEKPNADLMPAYLSFENTKILKSLFIFESSEPAQIFKVCQEGLEHGLKVIDFRILRTQESPCYLMLTSSSLDAKAWDYQKFENVKASYLPEPKSSIRNFLDISI
jgi:hypothetical protein